MKNMSIRTKILGALVLVNLLGAVAVMVYLHNSYSSGLDVTAERSVELGRGSWEQLGPEAGFDPAESPATVAEVLSRMKEITGADYGMLLAKDATTPESYAQAREAAGMADNWDERDEYVLMASTDEGAAGRMEFDVTPDSVPEIGRMVGVENGACTKTCHDNVRQEGAYWAVAWSDDGNSRTHGVFPVSDAGGRPVGIVYTIADITAQADSAESTLMQTLLVIGVTLFVATLVIGMVVDLLVFKRLNRMVEQVQDISVRMAGGDFEVQFTADGSNDEIGKFEQFFSTLVDVMTGTLKSLQRRDKAAG